ncbi:MULTISPECIES: polymorphic toxin type 44 domain-containing protein [Priestia]|uniref:polymorphic toxin type 44 domain-containing protein n=1 Tax=Priestia TaxID=2800373 RepID=UPI0006995886|nr:MULTISPECIES: polymorphic toxin type 44 domain-containing protein [Priestia]MBX4159948.1 hypothetical protein [Priestia megaterium]
MKRRNTLLLGFSMSAGLFLLSQGNVLAAENVQIKENVYQEAASSHLLTVTENGQVEAKDESLVEKLADNDSEYKDFTDTVDSINYLVEKDVAKVNNDFNIEMLSPEEITEVAHNSYASAETSQKFSTFAVDTGLTSLNLKRLVESNRKELEKFNASVLKTSPGSAYNATVGYFVGKVQEGGPWDYKVRSGYKPWYKEFNASTYNGKKVINSEYIGNYNYAYTGELLFSKKTLLIGGGAVGVGVGQPEDSKDKDVITKGYNDAVKYW